ncbi:garvicin Q family class II bacteriocin, partial [Streptococcus mutans]|nr:garvicin Q family class II bacteriocin [Streptococcus mutans]
VTGGGLYDGANGYAYRDSQGHWAYKVTKTPAQALTDVVVNSWTIAKR